MSGPARLCFWLLIALLGALPAVSQASAEPNAPPDEPIITTPGGDQIAPGDVHMELADSFHDPDGDGHVATDWEIVRDGVPVWIAHNSTVLLHAHLGDGAFVGPLAGQRRLGPVESYALRVRFQDSRGAWSAWAESYFVTSAQALSPLRRARGLLVQPAPEWLTDGQRSVRLPEGARARLEAGETTLLRLEDQGQGMVAVAGDRLPEGAPLRVVIEASATAELRLPSSQISLVSDQPERVSIYLPAIDLAAGAAMTLWVTETGATFHALADGSGPDRERLARDTAMPWRLEPGHRAQVVTTNLQLPTSLAFVTDPGPNPGDPRFYVSELHGGISVVTNDGQRRPFASGLLDFAPNARFPGEGEIGVVGVCVPPGQRDVYATLVYLDHHGTKRNKVTRLRSTDGLQVTAREDILLMMSGQGTTAASHQIQQCAFGPDGALYVSIGDGLRASLSRDEQAFNGKIIRLDLNGAALADNPLYDPADPASPRSYILSKGHRNAYGLTWRAADGRLYLAENGPDVDRIVRVTPGADYGWDGTNGSMRTGAHWLWPEPRWAPVGIAFADGPAAGGLGPAKEGHLFVGSAGAVYAPGQQMTGKAIQEFVVAPDGAIVGEPTVFARYAGEGQGTVIDVKLQPDGLWFTSLYAEDGADGPVAPGGGVWRASHVGLVDFTAQPAGEAATIQFVDHSTVRDAVAWRWDFGDGGQSAEREPLHRFPGPGRYVVSLRVTDAGGGASEHLAWIEIPGEPSGGVDTAPLPVVEPGPIITFPETGKTLGNGFKHFWEAHGGLAQFGYPLTDEFSLTSPTDGKVYTVQYFERARFEYHPEHKGTPYETQLGLLGREASATSSAAEPFQPLDPAAPRPADALFFAETGHTLSGPFRQHWERTGGATIYGLPISEPFVDAPLPGSEPRLTQWFERGRMDVISGLHEGGDQATTTIRVAPLGQLRASR